MRASTSPARLATLALAAASLAACADHVALPTAVPNASPLASHSGNAQPQPAADPTSSSGVTPTPYPGNANGENKGVTCTSLGATSSTTADASQQIGGYQFTVSGPDGSILSFAPIGTPNTTIIAVIVKGGDGYNVYNYGASGASISRDGKLISPPVGGANNNTPAISHYIVCSVPGTPTGPTLVKTLVGVMTTTNGVMGPDGTYTPGGPVTIPTGETRWLEYRIDYTLPAGVSATLSDNVVGINGACSTLGLSSTAVQCTSPGIQGYAGQTYSISVTGTGSTKSVTLLIDVKDLNFCGPYKLTNTATLNNPVGTSAQSMVTIIGTGPQCRTS